MVHNGSLREVSPTPRLASVVGGVHTLTVAVLATTTKHALTTVQTMHRNILLRWLISRTVLRDINIFLYILREIIKVSHIFGVLMQFAFADDETYTRLIL